MNMHDNYRLAKAQQERLRQMADEPVAPRGPSLFAALWQTFKEKWTGGTRQKPSGRPQRHRGSLSGRQQAESSS